MLKKRPENDRIYHEEIKILQHCYATTANSHNKSQPFVIVTWRNNEIGILDFGPHGVHYLSSTVSILLLSYFSLTKRRVNFTSFHWRSWTTNNDNNRGFNIFMWYYIFSVKCQSICIWALILLYFNVMKYFPCLVWYLWTLKHFGKVPSPRKTWKFASWNSFVNDFSHYCNFI